MAAIIATIHLKKYFHSSEKYFFYFLWIVVVMETVGAVLGTILQIQINWMYIIYTFLSFLFYFIWFNKIVKTKNFKKIILLLVSLFVIIAIKDFITESWKNYHQLTFVAGAINIIIFSFLYFSELLNSNQVLNLKEKLSFWISTGLLLFNVGMVPLMVFSERFNANNELRIVILICLNAILYTCYSLGFIWSKKEIN